jgi:hypothetical protein
MTLTKLLIIALALTATLFWANLGSAQCRGGGGPGGLCPVNQNPQTNQNTWQGRGQGNANCPYYPGPGVRRGGQGRGMNAQGQGAGRGPRGPQGRGMNTQTNNPNQNQ